MSATANAAESQPAGAAPARAGIVLATVTGYRDRPNPRRLRNARHARGAPSG